MSGPIASSSHLCSSYTSTTETSSLIEMKELTPFNKKIENLPPVREEVEELTSFKEEEEEPELSVLSPFKFFLTTVQGQELYNKRNDDLERLDALLKSQLRKMSDEVFGFYGSVDKKIEMFIGLFSSKDVSPVAREHVLDMLPNDKSLQLTKDSYLYRSIKYMALEQTAVKGDENTHIRYCKGQISKVKKNISKFIGISSILKLPCENIEGITNFILFEMRLISDEISIESFPVTVQPFILDVFKFVLSCDFIKSNALFIRRSHPMLIFEAAGVSIHTKDYKSFTAGEEGPEPHNFIWATPIIKTANFTVVSSAFKSLLENNTDVKSLTLVLQQYLRNEINFCEPLYKILFVFHLTTSICKKGEKEINDLLALTSLSNKEVFKIADLIGLITDDYKLAALCIEKMYSLFPKKIKPGDPRICKSKVLQYVSVDMLYKIVQGDTGKEIVEYHLNKDHTEVIDLLLSKGVIERLYPHCFLKCNKNSPTCYYPLLVLACKKGKVDCVKIIFKFVQENFNGEFDFRCFCSQENGTGNILLLSVASGQFEVTQYLLQTLDYPLYKDSDFKMVRFEQVLLYSVKNLEIMEYLVSIPLFDHKMFSCDFVFEVLDCGTSEVINYLLGVPGFCCAVKMHSTLPGFLERINFNRSLNNIEKQRAIISIETVLAQTEFTLSLRNRNLLLATIKESDIVQFPLSSRKLIFKEACLNNNSSYLKAAIRSDLQPLGKQALAPTDFFIKYLIASNDGECWKVVLASDFGRALLNFPSSFEPFEAAFGSSSTVSLKFLIEHFTLITNAATPCYQGRKLNTVKVDCLRKAIGYQNENMVVMLLEHIDQKTLNSRCIDGQIPFWRKRTFLEYAESVNRSENKIAKLIVNAVNNKEVNYSDLVQVEDDGFVSVNYGGSDKLITLASNYDEEGVTSLQKEISTDVEREVNKDDESPESKFHEHPKGIPATNPFLSAEIDEEYDVIELDTFNSENFTSDSKKNRRFD